MKVEWSAVGDTGLLALNEGLTMKIHKVVGLIEAGTIAGLSVPSHKDRLFNNKRIAKKAGAFNIRTVIRTGTRPRFFSWVDKQGFKVVF